MKGVKPLSYLDGQSDPLGPTWVYLIEVHVKTTILLWTYDPQLPKIFGDSEPKDRVDVRVI